MANWVPPKALTAKYGEEVISDLLEGPSTLGEKRTKATLVDKERGMLIHLRCSDEEEIYFRWRTRSSFIKAEFVETEPTTEQHYIGETPDGEEKFIYFGRIEHFFMQEFAGETRKLVYVNWFSEVVDGALPSVSDMLQHFQTLLVVWLKANCILSYCT